MKAKIDGWTDGRTRFLLVRDRVKWTEGGVLSSLGSCMCEDGYTTGGEKQYSHFGNNMKPNDGEPFRSKLWKNVKVVKAGTRI
jgi:hypothetical protein